MVVVRLGGHTELGRFLLPPSLPSHPPCLVMFWLHLVGGAILLRSGGCSAFVGRLGFRRHGGWRGGFVGGFGMCYFHCGAGTLENVGSERYRL